MELDVLRSRGLPESSVLHIRLGNSRRQARFNELDYPLKYPDSVLGSKDIKIDVFNLLGSTRLPVDGSLPEYTVDFSSEANNAQEPMEVTFQVRPYQDEETSVDGDENRPLSKTATSISSTRRANSKPAWDSDFTFKHLDENHDGIVTQDEFRKAVSRREKRRGSKQKDIDYLDDHGLVSFMQGLAQSLMKDKPSDPYAYIQRQIVMRAVEASGGGQRLDVQPEEQEEEKEEIMRQRDFAEIAFVQDEVQELSQENKALAEELRQMRAMIGKIEHEISGIGDALAEST